MSHETTGIYLERGCDSLYKNIYESLIMYCVEACYYNSKQ